MSAGLVETVLAVAPWAQKANSHDERHWRAVAATGLYLCQSTANADPEIVFAFGVLHDARRRKLRGEQGNHGQRAERFARELHEAGVLALYDDRLEVLCLALRLHSEGLVSDDATIGTAWDSDRLQLIRVGRPARPNLLSTEAARTPEAAEVAALYLSAPPTWDEILARSGVT